MCNLDFGNGKELTLQAIIQAPQLYIITTIYSNSQHIKTFEFRISDSPHLTDGTAYCVA